MENNAEQRKNGQRQCKMDQQIMDSMLKAMRYCCNITKEHLYRLDRNGSKMWLDPGVHSCSLVPRRLNYIRFFFLQAAYFSLTSITISGLKKVRDRYDTKLGTACLLLPGVGSIKIHLTFLAES